MAEIVESSVVLEKNGRAYRVRLAIISNILGLFFK